MRNIKKNAKASGFAVPAAWLALVLILPSLSFGGDAQGHRTAFTVGAGVAFHTGQDFDPGFLYQAGFFTLFSSRLGFEFLVAGNRVNMNEPPAPLGSGDLATTQFLISGQYRLTRATRFIPYAIFGVEFNFLHFWPDDEAEEYKHDFLDRLAPHFGAGLDWALSDRLALNAEARYSIVVTWVEDLPREGPIGPVNPDEVDKISLSALAFSLGLKFYF